MQITRKCKLPYEPKLYQQLKEKQLETAKLWNDIVRYANQHYFYFKKWISKGELEKLTQKTYNLSSQTVQAMVAKYDANRQTIKENRKTNQKMKYPWRTKRFQSVPYKELSMEVTENKIILKNSDYSASLGLVDMHKRATKKRKNKKDIAFYTEIPKQKYYIEIPNVLPKEVTSLSYAEIVWKKGSYWLHYTFELEEKENINPFKPAGGDLGEIHAITVATEDKALVVSGRAIRSIKQWRAKKLAELSKLMSRCKKHSRQWKKYNYAKGRLKAKSEQQLEYLYHKTTKEVMDFLEQEHVTHFVVGNPQGIEQSTKKNPTKKAKTTKKRRQQLSQWSYGEIKQRLTYKAQLRSIHIDFVNEAYTSQDCPFCGGRHKASGRNFICSVTKQKIHRDVNGAQNITRKKYTMDVHSVDITHRQPVWYKQYLPEYVRQMTKQSTDKPKKYRHILMA